MPTYQYACTECGHAFEQVQSFSDDALTVCPQCEGRLRKVYNAVGVVFKGSGFYRTDSRSPEPAATGAAAANGASKDGSKGASSDTGKSSSDGGSSGSSSTSSSTSSNGSSSNGSSAGSSAGSSTKSPQPAAS